MRLTDMPTHHAAAEYEPSMKPNAPSQFKGNKQALPTKDCVACGRPMSWRKRWARNWDDVKYCSDACRKAGRAAGQA